MYIQWLKVFWSFLGSLFFIFLHTLLLISNYQGSSICRPVERKIQNYVLCYSCTMNYSTPRVLLISIHQYGWCANIQCFGVFCTFLLNKKYELKIYSVSSIFLDQEIYFKWVMIQYQFIGKFIGN